MKTLDSDSSIRAYLQYKANKHGNIRVARAEKRGETVFWTKHRTVLECSESEEGLVFLGRVNNRSLFESEIVLDLDNPETIAKLNEICKALDEYGFRYYVFFTGSKGYHIHFIVPELVLYPKIYRERIRSFLIKKFGADLLKKSESVLLALEGVPHYKTGKLKTLVRRWGE